MLLAAAAVSFARRVRAPPLHDALRYSRATGRAPTTLLLAPLHESVAVASAPHHVATLVGRVAVLMRHVLYCDARERRRWAHGARVRAARRHSRGHCEGVAASARVVGHAAGADGAPAGLAWRAALPEGLVTLRGGGGRLLAGGML